MKYRPDIDGLRAIAVLAVIIFHISKDLLPAGFLGVDFFFIISGFVITRSILDRLKSNKFSLTDFYFGRFKRILPALFTLLAFTSVLAYLTLTQENYEYFLKSLRYSALQISNFLFAKNVGYFDTKIDHQYLLHTWSLSVEEQFYIFWPIFILALYHFSQKLRNKSIFIYGLIGLTLGSITIAIYQDTVDPKYGYYMFYNRIWQFSLGALATVITLNLSRKANNNLSFLALTVMACSLYLCSHKTDYVLLYILPSLACSLFILINDSLLHSRLLSNNFFRHIGNLSYSLYLWHWPIICIFKLNSFGSLSQKDIFYICVLTYICSYLSYTFIETPLRNIKSLKPFSKVNQSKIKNLVFISSAFICAAIVSCSFILKNQSSVSRLSVFYSLASTQLRSSIETQKTFYLENLNKNFTPYSTNEISYNSLLHSKFTCSYDGVKKTKNFKTLELKKCLIDQLKPNGYLIIGDSHGRDLMHILRKKYPTKNIALLHQSSCMPNKPYSGRKCFPKYIQLLSEILQTTNINAFILAAKYNTKSVKQMSKTLKEIKRLNVPIYITGSSPSFKAEAADIALYDKLNKKNIRSYNACHLMYYDAFKINSQLKELSAIHKSQFIDKMALITNPEKSGGERQCSLSVPDSDVSLYIDGTHFSQAGINYIARELPDFMKEIE